MKEKSVQISRGFKLVTRGLKFVARGFELVTRGFELEPVDWNS